jgi:RNA-directed DNA polymerase
MNIADHARRHVPSRYLLRLDVREFFESITADDVAAYIQENRQHFPDGWDDVDTLQFTQLVCRDGRLTIGAVTSPGLSNALCWRLDADLATHCSEIGVTYSRYADDLFFSTSTPDTLAALPPFVRETLKSIPYPASLELNEEKTRHSSMKRRRRITGLILTNDGGVSLGRNLKRSIRSRVYRLEEITDPAERNRLAGLLAYVRDIEPAFFNRLVLRYGAKVSEAARPIALS